MNDLSLPAAQVLADSGRTSSEEALGTAGGRYALSLNDLMCIQAGATHQVSSAGGCWSTAACPRGTFTLHWCSTRTAG